MRGEGKGSRDRTDGEKKSKETKLSEWIDLGGRSGFVLTLLAICPQLELGEDRGWEEKEEGGDWGKRSGPGMIVSPLRHTKYHEARYPAHNQGTKRVVSAGRLPS